MKIIIEDDYLAALYHGERTRGKPRYNAEVEAGFIKRIIQMEQASNTQVLRALKSLHFEKLSGSLDGKHSIRVNKAFRIVFRIEKDGADTRIEIICVEELNNHYS